MKQQRVYPYDRDFQKGVMALYCQDPGFRRQYDDVVNKGYFDDAGLIEVCALAKKLHKQGVAVTKDAVEAEYVFSAKKFKHSKKHAQMVKDTITDVYDTVLDHLDYIPDKAVKFAQTQAVATACQQIAGILEADGDIDQIKSIMDKALQVGSERNLGNDFFEAAADIGMLKKSMMHDVANKIPTGIKTLDDNMRGGLSIGELGMIIGPTGRGKSIILVNLAAEALKAGKNVVYITFELFEHEVLLRFFQKLTGSTDEQVLEEDSDFRGKMNEFLKAGNHKLRIKYFPPSSLSSTQLRAYLSRLQAQEGWTPDLLILDDADSMRIPKPGNADSATAATYQALGVLYSDIIGILVDFTCAAWVACQATRSAFDSEMVGLEHTADSFKKAHKANMALALCQTPEEAERDEARLFVAKARAYRSGFLIPIKFNKPVMQVIEKPAKVRSKALSNGTDLDGTPRRKKAHRREAKFSNSAG